MGALRARWRDNTGQVLVIFVLAIPMILGMCALVIDAGNLFAQKRSLQKAADAAALAATQEPPSTQPPGGCTENPATTCNTDTAQFASNFTKGNGENTSLVRCDPLSGVETNCYYLLDEAGNVCALDDASCFPVRVRVLLSREVTTFFGGIIGKKKWIVAASGRAYKINGVVGGTTTVIGGSTTVIGGTTIITPG